MIETCISPTWEYMRTTEKTHNQIRIQVVILALFGQLIIV